jgi:DNA-binding FadR family transcriptional regulator
MAQTRLSDKVVASVAIEILTGGRASGALLPTEAQLAQQFDVSRTVIREAVGRMVRCGLIEVRQGLGSFVRDREHWNELDQELIEVRARNGLIGDLATHLHRTRLIIEVEAVTEAAARADDAHLARIRALLERMRGQLETPDDYIDSDIAFHDAIIAASGNRLLGQLMKPINQIRRIASLLTLSAHPYVLSRSLASHEDLFALIEAHDVEGARAAMAAHVNSFAWTVGAVIGGGQSDTMPMSAGMTHRTESPAESFVGEDSPRDFMPF